MDEAAYPKRVRGYLEYASESHSDSLLNAIAHMERDLTDLGYTAPVGQVDGGALGFFDYEPYTHAYVPRDAFDEFVQEGPWTFARKGDVSVALARGSAELTSK